MASMTETMQPTAGVEISAEKVHTEVNALLDFISDHIPDMIQFGVRILIAFVIFIVGRFLIKLVRKRTRAAFERKNADIGVTQFTDSFLKFALYLLLFLIVATNLGIELSSITVIFASAGVAISLSLQETLSNFMGGLLILIMKPFAVGDYIIEDTNKNEGTVKEIQTFYTKLTTVDNRTIVIPNGTLANNSMTNVTARAERQLDLRVGISYNSDLKKAKELLMQMLRDTPGIIQDESLNVFVDELGQNAVVLGIRAWVRTEEYGNTRWSLLENIKLTFDAENIEIPYNQLMLHVGDGQE